MMLRKNGSATGHFDDFSSNTIANYTEYASVGSASWSISGGLLVAANSIASSPQSILTRNGVSFSDGTAGIVITRADDAGVALRVLNQSNYYCANVYDASSGSGVTNQVRLYKRVSGSFTQLGSTQTISFTRNTAHTLEIVASGTTISLKFDGVTKISVTDSSLSSGKCGPRTNAGTTNIDSFTCP
ncbi:MAG: hypothetical protein JSR63_07770 [Proteobacteria bacterium]|nr:hypothetical protein [Pseudomonadota bacterium]